MILKITAHGSERIRCAIRPLQWKNGNQFYCGEIFLGWVTPNMKNDEWQPCPVFHVVRDPMHTVGEYHFLPTKKEAKEAMESLFLIFMNEVMSESVNSQGF